MSLTLLPTMKSVQAKNAAPVDWVLSPQEFLRAFCHDDEDVCLRVFDDCPKAHTARPFHGKNLSIPLECFDEIMPLLKRHNEKKRGIFFVVNRGGQKDADIKRITAHFVENDELPVDEQLKLYRAFSLPPSILVRTRRSVHAYWLMDDAEVSRFRSVQEALIQYFHGDKACANPSRVLRLPGFYHSKEEPVMVTCLRYDPWQTYTQDELLEALDIDAASEAPEDGFDASLSEDKQGLDRVVSCCAFIHYCRENAASLPEPLWYAMITNLSGFSGGRKAIHELSESYPGYNHVWVVVAPFAGAWIERIWFHSAQEQVLVAPFAGAWIERSISLTIASAIPSRPSRARGLKGPASSPAPDRPASRPSRARGLKVSPAVSGPQRPRRALRGRVD